MSEYEHRFGRPLPAGYIEVPLCTKCQTEGKACVCQHNGLGREEGVRVKHADGTRLTRAECVQLYRATHIRAGRVRAVRGAYGYNPVALGVMQAAHAGAAVFHGTRGNDEVALVEQAQLKRARRAAKRLRAGV